MSFSGIRFDSFSIFSFLFFLVFNWGGVDRLCEEARSIPNAKLGSSFTQWWIHLRRASPRCFPYTTTCLSIRQF